MDEQSPPPSPPRPKRRLARWYTGAAVIFFSLLVLFILLNLGIWIFLKIRPPRPAYLGHPDDYYRNAYPTMPDWQWKDLVRETKGRPYGYAPYAMFTELPYHGQYVNISEYGFRMVPRQGPWPMDPKNYNVMLFGGSTMFSSAGADDKTIPAYLQPLMQKPGGRRVCVYNFARGAFFSTLERIQFEQLLRDGAKPNLALFMDGQNEFLYAVEPTFIEQEHDEMLTPVKDSTRLLEIWQALPAGQLQAIIAKRYFRAPYPPPLPPAEVIDPIVIDRYVWNKSAIEAICAAQGIAVDFIFEPSPTYHYPALKDKKWENPADQPLLSGYPLMVSYMHDHKIGDDFLWLPDLQKDNPNVLYLDKWHYSPEFSRQVADEICKFLEKRGDIPAK